MTDLLIPIGRKVVTKNGVPLSLVGNVYGQALQSRKQAQDLAYTLGGRDKKPVAPIMVYKANGDPLYLIGAGEADAAELEDLALKGIEETKSFSFDEARERAGMPRKEETMGLMVDALKRHRNKLQGKSFSYSLRGRKR